MVRLWASDSCTTRGSSARSRHGLRPETRYRALSSLGVCLQRRFLISPCNSRHSDLYTDFEEGFSCETGVDVDVLGRLRSVDWHAGFSNFLGFPNRAEEQRPFDCGALVSLSLRWEITCLGYASVGRFRRSLLSREPELRRLLRNELMHSTSWRGLIVFPLWMLLQTGLAISGLEFEHVFWVEIWVLTLWSCLSILTL